MKIIVTGGAGFIGSHLSKRLIEENHEVYIIDCLHPYYSTERKRKQLDSINQYGTFHFFQKNLLDEKEIVDLFKEISPDAVIHLAALPGVAYSIEKPLLYVDYDVKATINVLEASGKAGVSKVIFASSSSVYGNHSGPFKEEMANGNVISPYAASKYSAESFCRVYEYLYGYQVSILRFFTVYGPWGRPDMAIGSFIKKLMLNEEITIFGEGSARDYTYIDDIIDGIYLSLTKLTQSEILNLGNGNPILMSDLLNEFKLYFPNIRLKREASRVGDVDTTWANIEKAKNLLGYEPKINIKQGISETVKWALENEKIL
jgi:UDP-glucuronate 4-epimerase